MNLFITEGRRNKMSKLSLTNCTGDSESGLSHVPVWYYDDTACPMCESLEIIGDLQDSLEEMLLQYEDLDENTTRLHRSVSELRCEGNK
jgi:hypothetical protein